MDDSGLAPPPHGVPVVFRLAELLPFRWWYVATLVVAAVATIVLWIRLPRMACWSLILVGWLVLAGWAATGTRTDLAHDGLATDVPTNGTLQVSGSGTTKTIPCNGGYLSVSGADNTITVSGHCTSVSVAGKGNRVTIDNTDAIGTTGSGNVVTYHWGSPNVATAGTSNTVGQG